MGNGRRNQVPSPSISIEKSVPNPLREDDSKWRFSFIYWKQIDYFGLDCEKASKKWFISLLDRLKELSDKTIEEVATREKEVWHFHAINWQQRNIPITKQSLNWIPESILNSEETEFYQFQISLALGRVIGFFNEENVFCIVLLDPMHNAQPSQKFDYRVDETRILYTPYQTLLHDLTKIRNKIDKHCPIASCEAASFIETIDDSGCGKHIFIDDEFASDIQDLMQNHGYEEIFWLLLDAVEALKIQKNNESQ